MKYLLKWQNKYVIRKDKYGYYDLTDDKNEGTKYKLETCFSLIETHISFCSKTRDYYKIEIYE